MNYTELHRIPGLLMLIDFEKAFDTISWKFIFETLDFFKFGPSIKKMDKDLLQWHQIMCFAKWIHF